MSHSRAISAEPTSELLCLDDLRVGQRFRSGTHTVTADEIQIFAYEFDPQPFHLNERAAPDSVFGGLVASGWHTAALTMKLLVTGGPLIAGGMVGRGGELEWLRPTRPGDVLRVESVVTAVTPSSSKPDRGTVTFDVRTLNDKDEVVQAATMKLIVPRRPTTVRSRAAARNPIAQTTIAVLGILHALTLASCAVGPDYRPAPMAVGGFHNASAVEARSAAAPSPPLDRWWTGFGDPLLTRIVERALEQNLDLAAALARVDQARAAARGAGAALLPTADATSQALKARLSLEGVIGSIGRHLPGFDRNVSLYDVGVGASWEIDLFGGLRRAAEAANAEAEAAEAAGAGSRITVAADAADAYFLIRGFQARLAFAREQVATDERLLELVRLRFARDVASDREVAQSEALLAQARSTVPLLLSGLEAELNRLDVLMGDQPGTHAAELAREAAIPAIPTIPHGDEPVDVLRRRPDVIAAERRLAASNARIGAALGEYYPKLSIAGLLGFESTDVDHLFRSATFQPQGIAGLRWRLFDFGKIDAEVRAARGAEAEALAGFRQSILRAAEDVENAFMALVQSEARTRELVNEVTALERARDTAETAYRGGIITLTDVLDADRLLLVAQDELAKTRADTARAAVASFRALGGGWSGSAGVAAAAAKAHV